MVMDVRAPSRLCLTRMRTHRALAMCQGDVECRRQWCSRPPAPLRGTLHLGCDNCLAVASGTLISLVWVGPGRKEFQLPGNPAGQVENTAGWRGFIFCLSTGVERPREAGDSLKATHSQESKAWSWH